MAKISSLAKQLSEDWPGLSFVASDDCRWSAADKTVHYIAVGKDAAANLLHETAHGVLDHSEFKFDIDLIKMERAAWDYAALELAPRYGVKIDRGAIETALDSYRDWLHARSLCPQCDQTGLQDNSGAYTCPICRQVWRPNDARRCALRRYRL